VPPCGQYGRQNYCPDRTRDEAHGIDRKSFEHADQRIGFGKEKFAEHQTGSDAVNKKIVPFDGGADLASDDGSVQLGGMGGLGIGPDEISVPPMAKPPILPTKVSVGCLHGVRCTIPSWPVPGSAEARRAIGKMSVRHSIADIESRHCRSVV
jgi:hypothetical protein